MNENLDGSMMSRNERMDVQGKKVQQKDELFDVVLIKNCRQIVD